MKPDDGYISYIFNPKAGATSSKLACRRFMEYLVARRFEVRVHETKSLDHAICLSAEAAGDSDCAMVVVVGGDGTVRDVAHGMQGSDKPLLMMPQGTENLLASELGFDERLKTLIKTFEAGYTRPLDLGKANGHCFTSILGFGFDARVVQRVSEQREGNIDYYDYFWPFWRTFWDYQYQPMRVEVDGCEMHNGPCLTWVGNISRYAMGAKILNNADYGDGLLDVCIYECASKLRVLKHTFMTLVKRHARSRGVKYCQGKNIVVSSDSNGVLSEMDGDPGPGLPVEIEVIPHAVNVMVPENAKPAGIRTRIIRAIG